MVLLVKGRCCGFSELHGISYLSNPEEVLEDMIRSYTLNEPKCNNFRFVMFSQANAYGGQEGGYGNALANFITENKLGSLTSTGWELNPNSMNHIKLWVWGIDWPALLKWYATRPRVEKVEPPPIAPAPPDVATRPRPAQFMDDEYASYVRGILNTPNPLVEYINRPIRRPRSIDLDNASGPLDLCRAIKKLYSTQEGDQG